MRRVLLATACAVATAASLAAPVTAQAQPAQADKATEYVVLYKDGASLGAARAALKAVGATIVRENTDVGVATVRTRTRDFGAAVAAQAALDGAASQQIIGKAPKNAHARSRDTDEKLAGTQGRFDFGRPKGEEPLAGLQWDMKQIGATAKGSHRTEPGDRRVIVGVIDTGVDGDHPDIKPNFNRALSRNFTVDVPTDANGNEVDGPCEDEPDGSCNDPADVDENEHGTHVASTIASPRNGLGIAGVAPNVQIVNLRAGQDSGYFFLQPTVDALTFAGKNGIDVVNMSYYIDPWAWNCTNNAADSPADRREQATVIKAAQRALDFAYRNGVTLVSAAGNQRVDYTKPLTDTGSPNFASEPGEEPRERTIHPSCQSMPSEGNHVIPVSSTGISERKAYYSSYGNGYVKVAAPGGDKVDNPDGKADDRLGIWAAYPESIARERGELNADGTPNTPRVVRDCKGGTCAYYQSIQGTSMAAPHAAGVAALIVSKYGKKDRRGGLTMSPAAVERRLLGTATPKACPSPRTQEYVWYTRAADGSWVRNSSTQTCEGTKGRNGFYGAGIISALNAVRR
ncbi:S8 family serine peptidase [Actinomadura flavalba]|uniref:S8 family serine peptidase n=1 Tax=Actinomadura flavalba TaxID=1120938 RepID=UPI00036AE039|nr:S8 family serine peptidase [Actinomadura flavalba]